MHLISKVTAIAYDQIVDGTQLVAGATVKQENKMLVGEVTFAGGVGKVERHEYWARTYWSDGYWASSYWGELPANKHPHYYYQHL